MFIVPLALSRPIELQIWLGQAESREIFSSWGQPWRRIKDPEMTTWNSPRVSVTLRGPDVAESGPDPMKLYSRLGVMPGDHFRR